MEFGASLGASGVSRRASMLGEVFVLGAGADVVDVFWVDVFGDDAVGGRDAAGGTDGEPAAAGAGNLQRTSLLA